MSGYRRIIIPPILFIFIAALSVAAAEKSAPANYPLPAIHTLEAIPVDKKLEGGQGTRQKGSKRAFKFQTCGGMCKERYAKGVAKCNRRNLKTTLALKRCMNAIDEFGHFCKKKCDRDIKSRAPKGL